MSASPFSAPRVSGKVESARTEVSRNGWVAGLDHEVIDAIECASTDSPRALQRHIGPSELGTPCVRKLAFRTLGVPGRRGLVADWRTRVGVGTHQWLAEQVPSFWDGRSDASAMAEVPLWLSGEGDDRISGSADLVLIRRSAFGLIAEVVDYKVVGQATLDKAARALVDSKYVTQAHLYGLGVKRTLGVDVEKVTVLFLPAAGRLRDAVPVTAEWDEDLALRALDRIESIRSSAARAGINGTAERAPTASDRCHECPFNGWIAGDPAVRLCSGHSIERERARPILP